MAEPKRSKKRKADKAPPPPAEQQSPKKSKESSDISVRVEVSPNNPDYDPVVVSFPRGVPCSIADDPDGDPPRFTCSRPKASSSRGRRVSGEDGSCSYSAVAAGRGHDGRLTKAYVCIYDRKDRTLRLIPAAERGTVFALDQAVKGYEPNVANGSMMVGDGGASTAGAGVTSAADRMQMLVESFGSQKKQRVAASRAANKLNVHSVVGAGDAVIKSVVAQEGISAENKKGMDGGGEALDLNAVAYEQARRKMLPPFDADADAPCKVYDAETIAGEVAWEKISRIVTKILKIKSEGNGGDLVAAVMGTKGFRPPSVAALLKSIDPAGKGSHHRIKAAFLLFLMLRFHSQLQRMRGVEGESVDDCVSKLRIPHEVGLRLFQLFASRADGGEGGAYVASRNQRSKLMSHALVLYAIAFGSEMKVPSINQLCRDMKVDAKEASLVLREAGFLVKKNNKGDVGASLSVPLKFPPPKRGRKT